VKVAVGARVGVMDGEAVRVTVGVSVGKPPPSALAAGGLKIPIAIRENKPTKIILRVGLLLIACNVLIAALLSKDAYNSL
jgi:hypothetical protein